MQLKYFLDKYLNYSINSWIDKEEVIYLSIYIYQYIYNRILAIKRMKFFHFQHEWTCKLLRLVKCQREKDKYYMISFICEI